MVTLSVDQVTFRQPIHVGELVTFLASVNYTGTSSMEVGIKVVAPSNPKDAYGMMRSAIDDPDPVLFIENLPTYWAQMEGPESGSRVPIGKANILTEGAAAVFF